MTMFLSPLVDVNEIDLSTTIPAVATSIGVLVLRNTWKGPELKTQLINDIDELIQVFGQPEEDVSVGSFQHGQSYEDIMAGAGFLQYGNNLYCTRVLAPSATFSGAYGTVTSAGTFSQYTSGNASDPFSCFASQRPVFAL